MNTIELRVKEYLSAIQRGEAPMSSAIIKGFGAACVELLEKQFEPRDDKAFIYRASAIGKPLCQETLRKRGAPRAEEPYNTTMKFLIGHMIEALSVAIMQGAGINVERQQETVSVDVTDDVTVSGSIDCVIDGKVYDIKSASPYAFTHKFQDPAGWGNMASDDPFGYLPQAYLYAEGTGLPFGGWIAINKATGEWAVQTPPPVDAMYRKTALKRAADNAAALYNDVLFARCFEAEEETYYRKKTGNTVLNFNCQYCSYKHTCWGDDLNYAENPKSKAAIKPKKWYIGEVK